MRKKKGDVVIGGSTCLTGRSEMKVATWPMSLKDAESGNGRM